MMENIYKKSILKGVFAKTERGYRLTAKNNRFLSLLILLLYELRLQGEIC